MKTVVIRDTFDGKETVGKMSIVEVPSFSADTIEQPKNHDLPDHSCLPIGIYDLEPHISGHLHEDDKVTPLHTYAMVNPGLAVFHRVEDIPEGYIPPEGLHIRVEALIHPDNLALTLLGCIGPGVSRVQLPDGTWEVTQSRVAFKAWRDNLGIGAAGHTLEIKEI